MHAGELHSVHGAAELTLRDCQLPLAAAEHWARGFGSAMLYQIPTAGCELQPVV
jgi:hypothetical protein